MKRYALFLVSAVSLLAFVQAPPLSAVDTVTDAQIASIRTHCTELRGSLTRLRQSDTLLRTNRGYLYLTISDKLMTPLNERIASNQLDGSALVRITADFTRSYDDFFDAYRDYDVALGDAQGIDCTRQPTTFYDRVSEAREERVQLHEANQTLVDLAREYRQAFDEFKSSLSEQTGNGEAS